MTGTASGTMFAGTTSGTVNGNSVTVNVTITQPISTMMTLNNATIKGNTISGAFAITSPLTANGTFTLTKK
jgi:hypothetical protein